MALWSLLGARGVDVLAWESFGEGWVTDVVKQLKLKDARTLKAPYGELPDLAQVNFDNDVVFTWNGTTSGVRVPNADWIPADRKGLTICDATSAAFAQDLDWPKLDVVTFSWQKVLGGEAAHGMIILSPRAVERLETYTPPWPLPKLFRLTKGGKLTEGIFEGETINTPSMLCVEDYIDALQWAKSLGGLEGADRARRRQREGDRRLGRAHAVDRFPRPRPRDPLEHQRLPEGRRSGRRRACRPTAQAAFAKGLASVLEKEKVAYDIGAYRDAPPGLRIWCGATVETADVEALTALARLRLRGREGQARQGGLTELVSSPRKRGSSPSPHALDARFRGVQQRSLVQRPDDAIQKVSPWLPAFSFPTSFPPPPSPSSRSAASRSTSSPASTRTNSPRSSATMTASPSARRPRSPPNCSSTRRS